MDELFINAALRELKEETGISLSSLDFCGLADRIDRDPRGRTISGLYCKVLSYKPEVVAGDDACDYKWVPITECKGLAFDHNEVIKKVYYDC